MYAKVRFINHTYDKILNTHDKGVFILVTLQHIAITIKTKIFTLLNLTP